MSIDPSWSPLEFARNLGNAHPAGVQAADECANAAAFWRLWATVDATLSRACLGTGGEGVDQRTIAGGHSDVGTRDVSEALAKSAFPSATPPTPPQ